MFTKGVKNLVWVFNPSSTSLTDWNPGETYYDVLSIDIYNDDNVHSSNSAAFDDFKTKWGLSKVLALSENGPIPDVNNMHTDEAVWSWWMPWYGTWSGKWPGQTKNEVWKSNMEDERIITLDKMPGWASYSEANSGTGTCQVAKATSTFNGDPEKAAGNKKEDKMVVTYALGKDGALINTTKLPDLTKAKTLSVDISVDGTGAAEGGVWIGLAFVRNGMADSAWTWEQSPSDGCWMEENGGSKTCTFDITLYKDDAGTEHPIDLDNLFSLVPEYRIEIPRMMAEAESADPKLVPESFSVLPNYNMDISILERSEHVYVQRGHFGWADIGTWASIGKDAPSDADGNVLLGTNALLYDCSGNIVRMPSGHTAVIKGLHDYVIAEEGEFLMICPREDDATMRRMHTDTKFGDTKN